MDVPKDRPPKRITPDELRRRLEANPRFRKADPEADGQVGLTFVGRGCLKDASPDNASTDVERVDGPTPHGGTYRVIARHRIRSETHVEITEYDEDDEPIFRTYGRLEAT